MDRSEGNCLKEKKSCWKTKAKSQAAASHLQNSTAVKETSKRYHLREIEKHVSVFNLILL